MLQEIAEQPAVLERTINGERQKIEKLGAFLRERKIDLIVLVARGSSDNASLFGRYLLEVTTGIPVSLSAPSVVTLYGAKINLSRCACRRGVAVGRGHRYQCRSPIGEGFRGIYTRYYERGRFDDGKDRG